MGAKIFLLLFFPDFIFCFPESWGPDWERKMFEKDPCSPNFFQNLFEHQPSTLVRGYFWGPPPFYESFKKKAPFSCQIRRAKSMGKKRENP